MRKVVTAYFADWDIYGRGYFVKDIPADKLNVIQYAFGPAYRPSAPVMVVLAVSIVPAYIATLAYWMLAAADRQRKWAYVMGAIAIANARLFSALERRARNMERAYEELKARNASRERAIAAIGRVHPAIRELRQTYRRHLSRPMDAHRSRRSERPPHDIVSIHQNGPDKRWRELGG